MFLNRIALRRFDLTKVTRAMSIGSFKSVSYFSTSKLGALSVPADSHSDEKWFWLKALPTLSAVVIFPFGISASLSFVNSVLRRMASCVECRPDLIDTYQNIGINTALIGGGFVLLSTAFVTYHAHRICRDYGRSKVASIEFNEYAYQIRNGVHGDSLLALLKRDGVRADVIDKGNSLFSVAIDAENWSVLGTLHNYVDYKSIGNGAINHLMITRLQALSEKGESNRYLECGGIIHIVNFPFLIESMQDKIADNAAAIMESNYSTPYEERYTPSP